MATLFTRLVTSNCRAEFLSSSLLFQTRSRLFSSRSNVLFHSAFPQPIRQVQKSNAPRFLFAVAAIGFGLSTNMSRIHCDAPTFEETRVPSLRYQAPQDLPPPPQSSVSLYQLSFGTVSGICAGIFIKKGAKTVAWFLGGIFVLLQYLSSASVVRVDWGRVATRFENAFHTKDAQGISQPPTVLALGRWTLNFLTADFQPRASFVAGLVLGLRIG